MQRSIRFSQFRNLGLEKDDYLVLNGDFQKGKMGNLVILIGPNNSGKSNVLDGVIKACSGSELSSRDITNLYFDQEHRKPSVGLVYRDDNYTFELRREINKTFDWRVINGSTLLVKPSVETMKKELVEMYDYLVASFGFSFRKIENTYNYIKNKTISDNELYDAVMESLRILYESYGKETVRIANGTNKLIWSLLVDNYEIVSYYNELAGNKGQFIREYLDKQAGLKNPTPKCIVYKESPISNSDLVVSNINDLQNYRFFKSLFKAMGIDSLSVQNAYNQFNQTNNISVLKKLQKETSKKLEKICKRFNDLYFASCDQYKFTLEFESSKVLFGMARGKDEEPITLEYQSTGFRWFFNLFFNFLATDKLEPGDIVIMDEPATNLHVQGQRELRSFIKEYAIENDVLFIVATHSPFLVDVDHYDELTVISTENNRSKIQNRFTAVNLDDPDSLLPIKESLTIQQNVLYDLDTEVYFVEGITDYNYLTMFKKLLNVKNIAFLPFNGVGKNSAQTKQILSRLLEVKFHKRSLLVDADKAGQDMFNQAQNSAFDSVHSLSEIKIGENKKAMMVEDLFSAQDKKKYPAISDKNSNGTSVMKDHCKLSDFSDTTVNHFKELFKILQD